MVSVIVPVYNSEKTLADCVRSILAQTYRDFELLLIDDGSKDGSGKLCDELRTECEKQGVICRVIHKENGGVSSARNCGMENASGEYFVCVDSDDVIEPCYLEDLVRTKEEHPELGHVLCGFRNASDQKPFILSNAEPLTVVTRKDYMRLSKNTLVLSPWLALYRTDIVRDNNIKMREDMSLGEDLIFNLCYLDAIGEVPIGVINKTNYVYRDSDQGSLNRKYRPDLMQIYETIDSALEHYLSKWGASDRASEGEYFASVFYRYVSVLKNTFHKQNTMSRREKLEYNNSILAQESFKNALKNGAVAITPAIRRAYGSGDYRRVLAAERIQRIKLSIRGIFNK